MEIMPNLDPALDVQAGDGALLILPRRSEIPALFDEVREGLGTSDMFLEEMRLEMRRIRGSRDYEGGV